VVEVGREEDGSTVVRSFRGTSQLEWRKWVAKHAPKAKTVNDLEAGIKTGKVPRPFPWSSPTQPDGYSIGVKGEFVAELQVWPAEGAHPRTARVTLAEGLTPAALQRFPWKSMLTIADAALRIPAEETLAGAGARLDRAFDAAFPNPDEPRRPGRKGHPDEFYQAIAKEYHFLVAKGATDPTTQLAHARGYNRSTVAGWVSTARQRGYLPAARIGRPG
jgi:hypothetical protein